MVTKKYVKKLIVLFLLFSSISIPLVNAQIDTLKGLKDVANFPIGSAISIWFQEGNKKLQELHLKNFNSITATNSMKMHYVANKKGKFNFDAPDKMLEFAEKYNQRLFGHALIWHSATPKWVEKLADDPKALDNFMKEFIHAYVGRYKGKVDGWDVVNEAMDVAGGNYRETIWYKALGKEYIAKAFRYAHEADPDAVLFYNDFNTERDTAKLHAVIKMINELKAEGVPISGLGFQMHTRMDIPDETIAYCLKKGAETGLKIHLSEVDIIFNKHEDKPGSGIQIYDELTEEMKQKQAEKYKNLVLMYRKIVPKEQQYGITFWGYADKFSWIKFFFRMKDWPCIYDDDLQPKPAYYGFMEGLTEEIE